MTERSHGFLTFFHRGPNPYEISPADLQARLKDGPPVCVIDCREPVELSRPGVTPSEHLPLGQIPASVDALRARAAEADLVIVCAHGQRSLHAARFLRNEGIANVWSLAGGLKHWR